MNRLHPTIFVLACAAAAALGVLVYLPGLPGGFVFDDFGTIINNPSLYDAHASLMQVLMSAPVGGLLRPISTLSFMLDAHLFGLGPLGFKATNIAIHLAAGTMLWLVAREILRCYATVHRRALDSQTIVWLSLAATTLWLVHPINLTSVLYAVQRDNSLSALFSAAAVYAYLAGRRRQCAGRDGTWAIWLATPLLIALGMLCKENAALVPVLLLVIEFTLLRFQGTDGNVQRSVPVFFCIFLLLPCTLLAAVIVVHPDAGFLSYGGRDFTLYERLLSEARITLDYLRWIFVPDLGELGLFHDDLMPSRGLLTPWTTLPSVLLVLGLLVGAVRWRARWPLLSLGLLWFFAGHLMESTVLPLELVFEHRNYLPSFGIVLGVVGTLYPAGQEATSKRLAWAGLAGCIALMALTTAMRAYEWRSELAFARNEVRHHPDSARAQSEMQWAYMGYIISSGDRSLVPQAVAAAERSKRLDPGSVNQDVGLAYMFAVLKDPVKAGPYLESAALRARAAHPSSTLQLALQSLLQLTDREYQPLYPGIRAVYQAALTNPALAEPCFQGGVWNSYGLFQEDIQDIPGALAAMHHAVTLCPGDSLMHVNFASMLLRYGDVKDAEKEIQILRAAHDLRHSADIARVQAEYERQAATAGK